jgi:hypothetical protein
VATLIAMVLLFTAIRASHRTVTRRRHSTVHTIPVQ